MEPFSLKVLCIPVILVLNALAGGVPFFLIHRQRASGSALSLTSSRLSRYLSLASCFSAGVFLATCFVGLFPSVDNKYRALMAKLGRKVSYPVPEVTVCGGFFAVWFLEQLLHNCLHKCCRVGTSESTITHRSPERSVQRGDGRISLLDHEAAPDEEEEEEHHSHVAGESGHGHSHLPIGDDNSLLRSILLTFALGSHSILEGLGFGLLEVMGQVINMTIAIVLHECLCAFSLGLQLANQRTRPCLATLLIATFSALIPIGIGIGLSVEAGATSFAGHVVTLVLQGMAAGTFIYVVFFEILPPEINIRRDRLWKVVMTTLGFLTIALLRLLPTDQTK